MPIPTPFYAKTAPLCESYAWGDWAGYLAAATYEPSHEHEYFAIRNSAALIDVSPLFKYEITGSDAERLLNRVMTRDISKCAVRQVMYSPWCDDDGKVIDDGTVARLADHKFRVTAADPNLRWFQDCGLGMDAAVKNVSTKLAALALQGPKSRHILKSIVRKANLDDLPYFRLTKAKIDGFPLTITRTGYTGALGYELWVAPKHAERLWNCLMEAGAAYGIAPAGIAALDMARIEAGLLLIEVDYISSHKAIIEAQKSSPFEIGLGWAVALQKGNFIGRKALLAEKAAGSPWTFIGLEVDWDSLEGLYTAADLAPQVAGRASRAAVPIYKNGRQIGQATSHTFSPILKKYIAIGVVESQYAQPGVEVEMEFTIEYARKKAKAAVVKTPFYNEAKAN